MASSAPISRPGLSTSVLFVCTFNSVRSPMAEAIARRHFGHRLYVESAGVSPRPLDPLAVEVMHEIGIDIRQHQTRSFNRLLDTSFDLVVSFSADADVEARDLARTAAVETEFWPTADPGFDLGIDAGSRETRLCLLRHIRDELTLAIRKRFGGAEPLPDMAR